MTVGMLLALASHRATDPGFSTSGTGAPVANWAGLLGAWASDLALFLSVLGLGADLVLIDIWPWCSDEVSWSGHSVLSIRRNHDEFQ